MSEHAHVHVVPKPQTVAVTITGPNQKTQKVEHELTVGDSFAEQRLVVALVGINQTGAIPAGCVIVDEPAGDVAGITFAAQED
ncbi:MAG: hypothetical protein ACJ752_00575 [Gaiellaceae bacterium]